MEKQLFGITIFLLLPVFAAAQNDEWQFESRVPSDGSIYNTHGLVFDGEDKLWNAGYYPATDEDGNPARVLQCLEVDMETPCAFSPVYKIEHGDSTFRFGKMTGAARDQNGDILVSMNGFIYNSGTEESPDYTFNTSRSFIVRVDHQTGEGMDVRDITVPRFGDNSHTYQLAVDGNGYVYYSAVFPGKPIRVLDPELNEVGKVTDSRDGFARAIAVNNDGTRIYQPTDNVYIEIYESTDGPHGSYELVDTTSIDGIDSGAITIHPKTGVIYATASGSGSSALTDITRWDAMGIYGFDPDAGYDVVDELKWHFEDDEFVHPYRGLAINSDGSALVAGSFSGFGLQRFVRGEPDVPAPPPPSGPPPVTDSNWNFKKSIGSDKPFNRSHGVAFDAAGNVWSGLYFHFFEDGENINPVYCLTPEGEFCDGIGPVYSVETGDSTFRFGAITGVERDQNGDILISVHGYRENDSTIRWNRSRAFLVRLAHRTGEAIGVAEVTRMREDDIAHATHHAVDDAGYIYYSTVWPGEPIRVLDKNFNPVAIVRDNRPGFARDIAVSPEGDRVYQPSRYESKIAENGDTVTVTGRLAVYEGSVSDGFEPLDTLSFIGMDPGAVAVDPQTGVIYAAASGTANDPRGDPDMWETRTIYGIKVHGQADYEIVDQVAWKSQSSGDLYHLVYRGLDISPDGMNLAIGNFGGPDHAVQLFRHRDAPEPVADPELAIRAEYPVIYKDSLFAITIVIGSDAAPVRDLHGIGFQVHQSEPNLEIEDVIWGDFFPGDEEDLILFKKISDDSLSVDLSLTRKANEGISGHGELATVIYRATREFKGILTISLEEVLALDSGGDKLVLSNEPLSVAYSSLLVWPGDTNNDGIVDMHDILPVGQYYDMSGPARDGFDVSWEARPAASWENVEATYADATGDGSINQNDILPVGLNFGKTRPGKTGKNVLARDEPDSDGQTPYVDVGEMVPGEVLRVEIRADADVMPESGILGISGLMRAYSGVLPEPVIKPVSGFGESDELLMFMHELEDHAGVAMAVSRTSKHGTTSQAGIAEIDLAATEHTAPFRLYFEDFKASSLDSVFAADFLEISASVITSSEPDQVVTEYALEQNYPNPFNPATQIRFALPERGHVNLMVYDLLGRRVATLVNENLSPGWHEVTFDAARLSSGVYIYRIEADNYVETRQMMFVK